MKNDFKSIKKKKEEAIKEALQLFKSLLDKNDMQNVGRLYKALGNLLGSQDIVSKDDLSVINALLSYISFLEQFHQDKTVTWGEVADKVRRHVQVIKGKISSRVNEQ
jgi:hypothetical protein